jgi:hypothetical protein
MRLRLSVRVAEAAGERVRISARGAVVHAIGNKTTNQLPAGARDEKMDIDGLLR